MRQITWNRYLLHSSMLSAATFVAALTTAVAASVITGTATSGITSTVNELSGTSSEFIGRTGTFIPLGFAFGAGMVSAVNPCGFSLLPAYLGLYLSANESVTSQSGAHHPLAKALIIGGLVTLGFVVLFAGIGIAISAGAQFLVRWMPWVGLGVGVALIAAGAWRLSGNNLYASLGDRLSARLTDRESLGPKGYFLFGLSYGTASLSCTLPIFLAVVGGSIAVTELLPAVMQFLLYALGMGFVITVLTVSWAFFKTALIRLLRRTLSHASLISAVLLLVAGMYIVYYWLTEGQLLESFA